jgi:hypothetical protein
MLVSCISLFAGNSKASLGAKMPGHSHTNTCCGTIQHVRCKIYHLNKKGVQLSWRYHIIKSNDIIRSKIQVSRVLGPGDGIPVLVSGTISMIARLFAIDFFFYMMISWFAIHSRSRLDKAEHRHCTFTESLRLLVPAKLPQSYVKFDLLMQVQIWAHKSSRMWSLFESQPRKCIRPRNQVIRNNVDHRILVRVLLHFPIQS